MKNRWLCLVLALVLLLSGCMSDSVTPASTTAPTVDTSTVPTVVSPSDPTTEPTIIPPVNTPTDPTEDPPVDPPVDPPADNTCKQHADDDNNGVCDLCFKSVFIFFDFYSINDLHGKLADADTHIGVDELTTYLKNARKNDENAFFLSAGDMWQGSPESNLTNGLIITDWMNELGFTAMTLGNHEFDWGEDAIKLNAEAAEFPLLAINVFDRDTNERVEYCQASVVVEGDGLQIGIIGAIGDCYSSIASDKSAGVYFKTGRDLTALVKAESERLRQQGVDYIIYSIHDGYVFILSVSE